MNPVVHFEIPYCDGERATKFYTTVFGWEMRNLGEQSGNYILATTAKRDAKHGFPAGAINGGFYPVKPEWPAQYPSVVIGVENIHEAILKINAHGGEVLGDPIAIPNFGLYVAFFDTEKNRLSIIQPTGM